MTDDYKNISSLKELDQAIADNALRLKAKEQEIGDGAVKVRDDFRTSFSGASLLASGVRSISRFVPFDAILLAGVRLLRNRLLRRR